MPLKLTVDRGKLHLSDEVEGFIRKEIKPQGNGAHVLCPKEYVGKTAYVVVCKE